MPFDAVFLSAVVQELQPLLGSRVDKLQQPARDMVLLHLRGREGGKLLLSANVNRPRIHLTQATFENPAQPPQGICHVLVNGRCAVENGAVQPAGAGRVLNRLQQ